VVRGTGESSLQAVLTALDRYPHHEKIAGLAAMALTNLAYKSESNVETLVDMNVIQRLIQLMHTFPQSSQVGDAGAEIKHAMTRRHPRFRQPAAGPSEASSAKTRG
jgi:hypothetical protein